jgi:hypothetical protein
MAMSIAAPAVVICVQARQVAPTVVADCANEAETALLSGWLAEQPDLLLLVAHAIELEKEVQAA